MNRYAHWLENDVIRPDDAVEEEFPEAAEEEAEEESSPLCTEGAIFGQVDKLSQPYKPAPPINKRRDDLVDLDVHKDPKDSTKTQ